MGFFQRATSLINKGYQGLKKGIIKGHSFIQKGMNKLGDMGRFIDKNLQNAAKYGIFTDEINDLRDSALYKSIGDVHSTLKKSLDKTIPEFGKNIDKVVNDVGGGVMDLSRAENVDDVLSTLKSRGVQLGKDTISAFKQFEKLGGDLGELKSRVIERYSDGDS